MKSRKLALYGLLTALAMILSYVEALIPFSFAVPGIKIGLANTVTVFALYKLTPKEALSISLVRVTLTAVLTGFEGAQVEIVWECQVDGVWQPSGHTGETMSFVVDMDTAQSAWRVAITVLAEPAQ